MFNERATQSLAPDARRASIVVGLRAMRDGSEHALGDAARRVVERGDLAVVEGRVAHQGRLDEVCRIQAAHFAEGPADGGSPGQVHHEDVAVLGDREHVWLVELARAAAFEIVDADQELAQHPVLLDELELLFTEEDESFLTKS
mgnify:CR=1 FL=1